VLFPEPREPETISIIECYQWNKSFVGAVDEPAQKNFILLPTNGQHVNAEITDESFAARGRADRGTNTH